MSINLAIYAGLALAALLCLVVLYRVFRGYFTNKGVQDESKKVVAAEKELADALYDKPVNEFRVSDNDAWKGVAAGASVQSGLDSHTEGKG